MKIHNEDECLDVECMSAFASIRANTAVFKGKYYYELRIIRQAGLMQLGWCTLSTPFSREASVGDDETSYAYDGHRVKKWHVQNSNYGEMWQVGDVIGSLIDLVN